jgi:hypothetical protein
MGAFINGRLLYFSSIIMDNNLNIAIKNKISYADDNKYTGPIPLFFSFDSNEPMHVHVQEKKLWRHGMSTAVKLQEVIIK